MPNYLLFALLCVPCNVEYRLAPEHEVRTLETHKEADNFQVFLYFLKCESHIRLNDGKHEVHYRCRHWKKLKFVNFIKAAQFKAMLERLGFETRITASSIPCRRCESSETPIFQLTETF